MKLATTTSDFERFCGSYIDCVKNVHRAGFRFVDLSLYTVKEHDSLLLSENWKNAYGEDGFMSERAPYYEGDRYTYSFRLQNNMEERVAPLGGKDALCKALDNFFGFGGQSVKQMTP